MVMRKIMKQRQRGFTLIELMIVVAIIGILAVLAIYGVSRYLKTSKTAEATNNIGAIQKNASEALTREKMSGAFVAPGTSTGLSYGFCASEAAAVPAAAPKGAKYTSGPADWSVGKGTPPNPDTGFYCLKFTIDQPQYYSYAYKITAPGTNTGDAINITVNGDLDGNGVTSEFLMHGEIATANSVNSLVWAPKAQETNPDE